MRALLAAARHPPSMRVKLDWKRSDDQRSKSTRRGRKVTRPSARQDTSHAQHHGLCAARCTTQNNDRARRDGTVSSSLARASHPQAWVPGAVYHALHPGLLIPKTTYLALSARTLRLLSYRSIISRDYNNLSLPELGSGRRLSLCDLRRAVSLGWEG